MELLLQPWVANLVFGMEQNASLCVKPIVRAGEQQGRLDFRQGYDLDATTPAKNAVQEQQPQVEEGRGEE
jgi:hypothetical protein